jgi:hypothetical protein
MQQRPIEGASVRLSVRGHSPLLQQHGVGAQSPRALAGAGVVGPQLPFDTQRRLGEHLSSDRQLGQPTLCGLAHGGTAGGRRPCAARRAR